MAQETDTKVTLAGVAAMVEALHERFDADRVPLPWCDLMRDELGVGAACTGNPATARDSQVFTPKTGLAARFYYVLPGYQNDTNELVRVGYVAEWRGGEYRGEIVAVLGYPDMNGVRDLTFYDATRYAATLPDGCRGLLVRIVADAAKRVGMTVEAVQAEKAAHNRAGAIYSATYAALRALRDAVEIDGGRVL